MQAGRYKELLTLLAIKTDQGYYRWDKVKRDISMVPLQQATIYTTRQITELEAIINELQEKGLAVCLVELSITEREWPDITAWEHRRID